jgi:hypothetical protein
MALATVCTVAVAAQEVTPLRTGSGGSPHVRTDWTIDGVHVSIEYGRPYLKGRQEAQMMPHGQVWRVGADEQTTLTVDKDLRVGTLLVPAGTYGLHAVPGASAWQLIVSKRTQGWGIPYPAGQDLGRTPMSVSSPPAHTEQVTISIDDTPAGALLHIDWGTTRASVPLTVA